MGPFESSLIQTMAHIINGADSSNPAMAKVMSRTRWTVSVSLVMTVPAEKINQLGRSVLTKIVPVSFS
jgi:hypothetical protein